MYTTYCFFFGVRSVNQPALTDVAHCHKKIGHPQLLISQVCFWLHWRIITLYGARKKIREISFNVQYIIGAGESIWT